MAVPFLFIFQNTTTVAGSTKVPKCRRATKEFLKPSYIWHLGATVLNLLLTHLAFSIPDKWSHMLLLLYEKSMSIKRVESVWNNTCCVHHEQTLRDVKIHTMILTGTVSNLWIISHCVIQWSPVLYIAAVLYQTMIMFRH